LSLEEDIVVEIVSPIIFFLLWCAFKSFCYNEKCINCFYLFLLYQLIWLWFLYLFLKR